MRGYVSEYALDAGWTELDASLRASLASGLSADSLESQTDIPISAIAGYSYEAHFCAPIVATGYAIEGSQALAKNDMRHASYCADRGLYWSSPDMLVPNPKERFSARAREGGKAKAFGYEPVKDKVAELLMKLAPEGGWETTTAATTAVANELTCHYSAFVGECGLETHNLPRTIEGWIGQLPSRFPHHIKLKT